MKEMMARLLEFTGDGAYRYTFDGGQVLLANQGFCRILDLQCAPESIVGKRLRDLLIYSEREGTVRAALETAGEIHGFEYHFKTLKGEDRWVIHDSFLRTDPATGERVVEAIVKDITRSKEAEARLAAERERLAVTLRSIGDGVIATDTGGRVVLLNQVASQLTGWTQDEAVGQPLARVFHIVNERTRAPCENPVELVLARGTIVGLANGTVLIARDGSERSIADSGAPILGRGGEILGVVLVFRDVTERMQVEQALTAERERLAVTLRSIGDGVIATDNAGRVMLLNRVAEALTGWRQEDAVGRPLCEVFRVTHEVTREPIADLVARARDSGGALGPGGQAVLTSRDGTERPIADSVAPIRDRDSNVVGAVVVFRDMTVKRLQEAEMQRIDKLESIGLLAGGIAHDFNNILTAILGNVSLARSLPPSSQEYQSVLAETEKACLRARDLTQQLLTFAKGGAPIKNVTRLDELSREAAGFALHGSPVLCRFDFPADLWLVDVDRGQISQVIHNLVINAEEAMPGGGCIQIRAVNVKSGEGVPARLVPGNYVRMDVIDTGVGIPGRVLPRIFDPYYTTKQKGSGLGLTTSFAIVQKHAGHISVESVVGRGTTFRVYLPALPHTVQPREVELTDRSLPVRGRVLVMDDEDPVRRVAERILTSLGCEAVTAADGEAALRLYREAREAGMGYAAVILDLTVPGGMGGMETLARLREVDPDVVAIVSSGYSTDPVLARFRENGFAGMIAKPYRLDDFAQALRAVLAEPREGRPS